MTLALRNWNLYPHRLVIHLSVLFQPLILLVFDWLDKVLYWSGCLDNFSGVASSSVLMLQLGTVYVPLFRELPPIYVMLYLQWLKECIYYLCGTCWFVCLCFLLFDCFRGKCPVIGQF